MMISSSNCNRNFPLYFPSLAISVFGCSKFPLSSGQQRTPVGASAALAADTKTLPQSAIQRIAEKLRSLGYVEVGINKENPEEAPSSCPVSPSPGEIFVPLRSHLPKHRVGHTLDPSWSTPGNQVPERGSGDVTQRFHELRRGVLKEGEEERLRNQKKERAPTLAELTLPVDEIKRLTSLGIGLKKKLKVGKAGITEGIVNGIHERWRRYEVVRIACEDICRLNMKRTHDLLERKTGGLVIWRSGSNIILFRGADYKYPYLFADNNLSNDSSSGSSPDINTGGGVNGEKGMSSQGNKAVESPVQNSSTRGSSPPLVQGVGLPDRVRFQLPGEALLAEEADKLLEGLGPRFTDWWGYDPLPVDADLLPAIVPGYRRPFRLLPYGVKPKLTNDEMTTLRRLGLPLPCHFALGRNRKLQGLAASIVKLWEKCEIAKIAIKRGVQNTNSELMAEELKWLTGGILLSRDREFISLYRGKDFLPVVVSSAIEERRQGRFSQPRTDNNTIINTKENAHVTNEYSPEVELNEQKDQKCHGRSEPRKLRFSEAAIGRTSAKLNIALAKKARDEKLLEELGKEEISQPSEADKEYITEEERYMLRRIGLKMGPFLLLGRRGVFDGTVENMHLHWKYRELVKILIGRRSIEEVNQVAQTLVAESGGILVAVERNTKGYAIIIYRGKNYKRPASLRPQTLLSKREALKRSLEAQCRQSLKLHVLELTKNIDELKLKMAKDKDTNNLMLAKDLKLGFVKEPETGEIYVNEDKSFEKDLNGEDQSHHEDLTEEIRENQETDTNSAGQENFVPSSKGSASVGRLGLTRDILHSNIDGKDACDMPREEPQPKSVLKDPQDSLKIAEPRIYFSLRQESQDQVNTSATALIQPHFRDSKIDHSKANLEHSAGKATQNESAFYRATQLSNRERLILRKQALRMKNRPVLAIGKRNILSGIARTINTHFKKHSLAIVSIKGRAEGTSIREVVHGLEQATGSVLVSQEPSKIILYKGRGSEEEPVQDGENTKLDSNNYRVNVERKGRGLVSPELMSAIRMECGLMKLASDAKYDGGSG